LKSRRALRTIFCLVRRRCSAGYDIEPLSGVACLDFESYLTYKQ
jgi:hypothetical protein